MDDPRSASCLISVDFAKAFNTMEHQNCLKKLEEKGALIHTVNLIPSFLTSRGMSFKVGSTSSSQRLLRSGGPPRNATGELSFCIGN